MESTKTLLHSGDAIIILLEENCFSIDFFYRFC